MIKNLVTTIKIFHSTKKVIILHHQIYHLFFRNYWYLDSFIWINLNKPKKFNLVELGPGNGTMIKDLIKTFKKFQNFIIH